MFYVQNLSIYMYFGGDVHGPPHIKKKGKSTRAEPVLKSNSTSFWFKTIFSRMNNKKLRKGVA